MNKFDSVVDSGQRREFDTGSRRDITDGKGRFDLLPFIAIMRLAKHYENGAVKYGDHNWRKGQPISVYINSGLRHFFKGILGWTDEDHWSAVVWNVCSIIETLEMIERGKLPAKLDDRYPDLLDDMDFNDFVKKAATLNKLVDNE